MALRTCLQRTEYGKGTMVTFRRKPGRHCGGEGYRISGGHQVPSDTTWWEEHLYGNISKKPITPSNHEWTSDSSKWRNILWTAWPVVLKTLKVIKSKQEWETITNQRMWNRDITDKCNVVPWIGPRNRKRALMEKLVQLE